MNQVKKGDRKMATIDLLSAKAQKYAEIHKAAFEVDRQGVVKNVATDEDGNICIKYSNGQWFHYRMNGETLEWW